MENRKSEKNYLANIGGRHQVHRVGATAVVLGQIQLELFIRSQESVLHRDSNNNNVLVSASKDIRSRGLELFKKSDKGFLSHRNDNEIAINTERSL